MKCRETGFTLIEIMIAMAILGTLTGVAIPAYRIYAQNSEMTVAETNLRSGLNWFAAGEDYHPPTGSLGELVTKGYLPNIPNDPWTSKAPAVTNTEEVGDWSYSNDGQEILLYALSGYGNEIRIPSLGVAAPGTAGVQAAAPAAPVSARAARTLRQAARWQARADRSQARLDRLAVTQAARQQALASAQAAFDANPSRRNRNALNKANRRANSVNNTIARVQNQMTNQQNRADLLTARAATQ